MKKKVFSLPYIGYDYGSKLGTPYDVLIGEFGNPIVAIKIKNLVTQYSADRELYLKYHSVLLNIISIIGEGHIVQKLDIFDKKIYHTEPHEEYLQQTYSDHFEGRLYKTIDTLLVFTHRIDQSKKKNQYKYSDKRYKELRDKSEKVFMLLEENGFEPTYFLEKDFEYYISSTLSMNFGKSTKAMDNLRSMDNHLKIGSSFVKAISLVDVENIELPNDISAYTTLGGNGATKNTAVDNFAFLNDLELYETVIYNQIIVIPEQTERVKFLANKRNKHEGFQNEPLNKICAEEITLLLDNIAKDGQLIVDAHYSLIACCKTQEEMEKTQSMVENQLFQKGIITSKNTYNQLELFRTSLIGNANELKEYDLFTTTSEASLCFFFKESYPIDEHSNFYLRFTDRQGVPLKVDTSDLPMTTNRINNRNKFVLGPSGSGKSFLMNNIVEQYLTYNYDVVIVDTGDSYSGTAKYKNGKYIQYTEEKPITMNPFVMDKEEFNIEKIEFLGNLIFLIWQGTDSSMSTTQKSILDNLLLAYYHQFFNGGTDWYERKSSTELILYLKKYNIYEEEIYADFENGFRENENYYHILGIPMTAEKEDIKKAFRRLAIQYHPDKNLNNKDYDEYLFDRIHQAYETLGDENKRKAYDETQLVLSNKKILKKPEINSQEWSDSFRKALIKKVVELEEKLFVKELSFNTFYEYSEQFLPIYLSNKKFRIAESEFNLRTFLYVLADFYKGGRYGTTLNESADNSLFDETLIVFEIDNVKDNPKLFPIVTLIIMDTFIQKMRLRKDRRKALIIEEAWKAIASKLMGGYILYLYKTVRKFWGEAVVVTQELDDIIGNAIVKDSIINNSDTFILLDQTKFIDNFDKIAKLLSLNEVEQSKIFTINNLNNKSGRSRFKEFYLKRGSKGEVYGNEVSLHQYLTYTTEKPEKSAIEYYVQTFGNYQQALEQFVGDISKLSDGLPNLVALVNLYQQPIDENLIAFYHSFKKQNKGKDFFKVLKRELFNHDMNLQEFIKTKSQTYEKI